MRTDKHEIKILHPLANIKIQPLDNIDYTDLKNLIKLALDSYALTQNIPARVIHTEMRNKHQESYGTPGYYLRLFRERIDLSQAKLAENIGIKQHHISEMEKNKRSIGKVLAKKFAISFGCDYKKFL
jgi:DNA-binding XRE family transcriptional regulator